VLVGEDGRARVLDFDVSGPRTASEVVDDLPYAPPEQLVRGALATRYVDPRRDVYGASVVLWETLTGRALFHESTVAGTLRKILEGAVPAPSSLAPGIGRDLDAIVLRGLARDPRARFAAVSAMAWELEKAPRASAGDVSRALAGLDLPCIRRRRALADAVRRREVNTLHFECTRSASKE
jgi:serine/threonine-protein kinase